MTPRCDGGGVTTSRSAPLRLVPGMVIGRCFGGELFQDNGPRFFCMLAQRILPLSKQSMGEVGSIGACRAFGSCLGE
ncbi:MAG: hypothetical protein RIS70_764 [Planctomycetota bacterium]